MPTDDTTIPPQVRLGDPTDPDPGVSPERLQLVRRLSRDWAARIQDAGGQNPLLYRSTRGVDLAIFGPVVAAKARRREDVALLANLLAPDERPAIFRKIRNLEKKAREYQEEQGLEVLFVALGQVALPKAGQEVRPVEAPLVLAPISLRKVATAEGEDYRLLSAGEPIVNSTLVRFLTRERQIDLRAQSEVLMEDHDDPTDLLDAFAAAILTSGLAASVDKSPARLGTFTFAQEAIVLDLEAADVEYLASHSLIAALAGDLDALEIVRNVAEPLPERALDGLSVDDEPLILPADSSQRIQIATVLRGDHHVIQGPPGTGKSQSIANMIAALAAREKTVLFVAEKRAALEAVQRRLQAAGLGHLMMDLHSLTNKSAAYQQVSASWNEFAQVGLSLEDGSVQSQDSSIVRDRDQLRDRLNGRTQAIESLVTRSKSYGELLSLAADVPESIRARIVRSALPTGDHDDRVVRIGEALISMSAVLGTGIVRGEHPFFGLGEDARVGALREQIPAVRSALEELASGLNTLGAVASGGTALGRPLALLADLDERRGLNFARTFERRAAIESAPQLGWPMPLRLLVLLPPDRRALWAALRAASPSIPTKDLYASAVSALPFIEAWHTTPELGGLDIDDLAATRIPGLARRFLSIRDALASSFDEGHRPPLYSSVADARGWLQAAIDALDDLDLIEPRLVDLRLLRASGIAAALGSVTFRDAAEARTIAEHVLAADHLDALREAPGWPEALRVSGARLEEVQRDFRRWDAAVEGEVVALVEAGRRRRALAALSAARSKKVEVPSRGASPTVVRTAYDLLRKEAGKQKQHPPLRRFIDWTGEAVIALRPCWAMSPLSVSQLLPQKRLFDVVIFDEASQVEAPFAIPAIARGTQAVVAGDQKQLPPTNFFKKLGTVDDDVVDWEDVVDDDAGVDGGATPSPAQDAEAGASPTEQLAMPLEASPADAAPATARATGHRVAPSPVLTSESILAAVAETLIRSGSLRWHYRSRDARLIAFSNEHIYRPWTGSLVTFPSPAIASPFRLIHVPRGDADRAEGASREEIGNVVNAVLESAIQFPDDSVGVIVFNTKLVEMVETELEETVQDLGTNGFAPESRERIERVLDEHRFERFFCKSIEQVQGDERDAIVLHVPSRYRADGRLSANFGVLNQTGGERRLNVAVTRAKRRMTVVSGITARDMAALQFANVGPELLRLYLDFAERGGEMSSETLSMQPTLTPFERSVMDALLARGHGVVAQVGSLGYRIDLAIRHPEEEGVLALGIECDGATYHSAKAARDRDRLRQAQLEEIGWRICRIWSTDWFRDPEKQVAKVESALADAVREGVGLTVPRSVARPLENRWRGQGP